MQPLIQQAQVVAKTVKPITQKTLSRQEWLSRTHQYQHDLHNLIYPKNLKTGKITQHDTHQHPIYNFLHRYYRYSVEYISKYSAGINHLLEDVQPTDLQNEHLHTEFLIPYESSDQNHLYTLDQDRIKLQLNQNKGKYRHANIIQNYQTLLTTLRKPPFYGCFGYHEWAMLYSGRSQPRPKPHQPQLPLRVSQEIIDTIVETPGNLKCTHYDAWRFFQKESQAWNIYPSLNRLDQSKIEQPGCIHANMDLFKYAYQLYPFISSELLLKSLEIAIMARKIDVRASPYDCSAYLSEEEGEEGRSPICVETSEGRKEYIEYQERLVEKAIPIRKEICNIYEQIIFS